MSNNLFGFTSKNERNDFYIALVVVLLFFFLFGWYYNSSNKLDISGAEASLTGVADTEIVETNMIDGDGDGVADMDDKCPEIAGVPENDGCPYDKDGDGVADAKDKCPELAGLIENGGCPKDSDGDGVYDEKDKCPNRAWNSPNGCPPDSDGDGVADPDDKCPKEAGSAMNDGCPLLTKEETAYLAKIQNIEFLKSQATLKRGAESELDNLVNILNERSKAKVLIYGHTDSSGADDKNLELSIKRAQTCKQYLMNKGIPEYRIQAKGFGESRPLRGIAPESPKNRRVEFNIEY